jgi:predicted dinucleotide-binding enzyme
MFASCHLEFLADLVKAGRHARPATTFGNVVLLSIPFNELPKFEAAKHASFGRKVVLEMGNPTLSRDGALAEEVMGSGRGTRVQRE